MAPHRPLMLLEHAGSGSRGPQWREHRFTSFEEAFQAVDSIVTAHGGKNAWGVLSFPQVEEVLGVGPIPTAAHGALAKRILKIAKELPSSTGVKTVYFHSNFLTSVGSFDLSDKRITTMSEETALSGLRGCASNGGIVVLRTAIPEGPQPLEPFSNSSGTTCTVCGKLASLQCAYCAEAGIRVAAFCSQKCYDSAWKKHREDLHGYEMCGKCDKKHWKDHLTMVGRTRGWLAWALPMTDGKCLLRDLDHTYIQARIYRFSDDNEIIHVRGDDASALYKDVLGKLGVGQVSKANVRFE